MHFFFVHNHVHSDSSVETDKHSRVTITDIPKLHWRLHKTFGKPSKISTATTKHTQHNEWHSSTFGS